MKVMIIQNFFILQLNSFIPIKYRLMSVLFFCQHNFQLLLYGIYLYFSELTSVVFHYIFIHVFGRYKN